MTLSRDELRAKLDELAKSPPPEELAHGAMCYKIGPRPVRTEYVCPTCQSKSVYGKDSQMDMLGLFRSLWPGRIHRLIKRVYLRKCLEEDLKAISDLKLSVDESELCVICKPSVSSPSLTLVVEYEDGRVHRYRGLERRDLHLIQQLLVGAHKYQGNRGREFPLKEQIPRLKKLLGLEDKA